MKTCLRTNPQFDQRAARKGVSLIEVIVSMLIMSIGIVLLATLLPISILRTAQATQMTQAVFLRNNAAAVIDSNPNILNNTAIPTSPNTLNYLSNGVAYAVIDPLGFQLNIQANFSGMASRPRFSGGAVSINAAETLAALPDSWSTVMEGPCTATIASLTGSPPSVAWAGSAPIPTTGINVRSIANQNYAKHRMVLSDSTGRIVALKNLYQVTGQNLYWWDPGAPAGAFLPAPFQPNGLTLPTRVRIEANQRRFTWLMTVKKRALNTVTSTWDADTNVAIFYNRAFSIADEKSYTVTAFGQTRTGLYGFDGAPGVAGVDDDNNGVTDWITPPTAAAPLGSPDLGESPTRGSDDKRTVTVTWTGTQTPFKKSGFMLDPINLNWYRILDVQIVTSTSANLLLDQDIQNDSVANPAAQNGLVTLGGIFMKGVIDVYPLGTINGQF